MTRYILIDNYSGYIWGDVDASTPLDAARATDSDNGDPYRNYTEQSAGFRPFANATAYHVYEGTPAIPDVNLGDGTNQPLIDSVTTKCRKVAVIEVNEEDDQPVDLYAAFE